MFTQLFASYLLNKKLVTPENLKDALDYQKNVHLKLGVMAVNAGFMTADNVNSVHNMQAKADKKFGEIAIEMGYLDEEKLNTLLSTQGCGHLLLGQAMVDKGYMLLEQFEEAINNYKKDYGLTDEQFKSLQNDDIDTVVNTFYNFGTFTEGGVYRNYLSLLIKNIIRFIDDDFMPLAIIPINGYAFDWMVAQEIRGEIGIYTCIAAEEKEFISLAGRYADEVYSVNDYSVHSSVGDFLDLINGLFLVNMSIDHIELEQAQQIIQNGKRMTELTEAFCFPVMFSFGRVDFIIAGAVPKIV